LTVGYFAGREHMRYQLMNAVATAFGEFRQGVDRSRSESTEATPTPVIHEKKIGEDVELATLRYRVTSVEEAAQLRSSKGYKDPISAKSGAKFIIVHMEVTNLTNAPFLYEDNAAILVDGRGRRFDASDDSIGGLDDYLTMRKLAPSITENGSVAYEVPEDAENLGLVSSKRGTNDVFKVALN